MFRVLLLILVFLNTAALAQTDADFNPSPPKPLKVGEFKVIRDDDFRWRIQIFTEELKKKPTEQGYVVNYGDDEEITERENRIFGILSELLFDASRITMVRGGEAKEPKTEMWSVPPSADKPVIGFNNKPIETTRNSIPESRFLYEFGELGDRYFKKIFEQFFELIEKENAVKGYILIRGSSNEITAFESKIRELESFQKFDADKIIFMTQVKDGIQATCTLWFVPEGQEFQEP